MKNVLRMNVNALGIGHAQTQGVSTILMINLYPMAFAWMPKSNSSPKW